jgi:hypothetical protein
VNLESSATRVWKRLPAADRLAAAQHLFAEPSAETMAGALAAITRARKMRPQAVRAMDAETQARAVAQVLDPGEGLAASLLVALHLGERRPVLRAFLDAVGLPHEDGILTDDDSSPVGPDALRSGVRALAGFPKEQVTTYLNTLFLQDPDRWAVLAELDEA